MTVMTAAYRLGYLDGYNGTPRESGNVGASYHEGYSQGRQDRLAADRAIDTAGLGD